MKYCKKCLQPNTRPGIRFTNEGICYACEFEESKKTIDWTERQNELSKTAEWAKESAKQKNSPYDCIVGVSGGKDSTFQALYAKEKLGLKVLLVNCVPDEITEIGRYNIENLIQKGFDIIQTRTDPVIMKKLTKSSFYDNGNPIKPSEYPLWASAYIIAEKFDIPLVLQGENAALTLGTVGDQNPGFDALDIVNSNTLQGKVNEIYPEHHLTEEDVFMYKIPPKSVFDDKNIKAIYLQYYLNEWSQVKNADFAIARGLWGRDREKLSDIGRYRRYTALDSDLAIVNQMLKYLKFGFGFATDEACYDIREGRLTREEAVWYVEEYDGKCGKQYLEKFCNYIDITEKEFWENTDRFVNKDLFSKGEAMGRYIPKFKVGVDLDTE